METENLVVGLGIAGINLCHQLEKAGKPFLVIDDVPSFSSSIIAGGIYNPVVLKRKVKSWKVDELFPFLVSTYRELEAELQTDFLLHDFPILKPISSTDELTEWRVAVESGLLHPYVSSVEFGRPDGPFQNSVIGSVTIRNGGFVRISKLIEAYRAKLMHANLLVTKRFSHPQLSVKQSHVEYDGIRADRILFTEGRAMMQNPFFSWIPLRPTKGQMITVRVSDELTPDRIYNQQFLLFPTEQKNTFRLGATYEWNDLNETPSQQSTDELIDRAQKALKLDFEVLDAQAAIRPNVADRRPVIGQHPEEKCVFLFNGMGSKGVMLAPYFAKQLVDHIYDGGDIDPEVNLNRFSKRYTNS